jgi:hypothetical protein
MIPFLENYFIWRSTKLGFFSASNNAIFAQRVQFRKTPTQKIVGSMIMWALEKHSFRILKKSIMMLGLNFMPPNKIINLSLNGLRK